MAKLHLMVGLPCSGKTTLARQLEAKYSALRLTTDEWHIRLFGHDYGDGMTASAEADHDSRHASVESFFIPESKLQEWVRIFEPPTAEELDAPKGL